MCVCVYLIKMYYFADKKKLTREIEKEDDISICLELRIIDDKLVTSSLYYVTIYTYACVCVCMRVYACVVVRVGRTWCICESLRNAPIYS